jgi:metal-dependent amidase/aminoacylase/carboxypeptidase family protein
METHEWAFLDEAATAAHGRLVAVRRHLHAHPELSNREVLTAAEVLASVRDRLPGTVMFVFQPAEEGSPVGKAGGAQAMVDAGGWPRTTVPGSTPTRTRCWTACASTSTWPTTT